MQTNDFPKYFTIESQQPINLLHECLKKLSLLGPESTGKSTLCKQLAEHYQHFMVPGICKGIFDSSWNELYL